LIDASTSTFLETQLEFERALMISSTQTADFLEGVTAFMEKREPQFSGGYEDE
jgi:enoyl-CoA hydratase/carnithine racemase